jgi:hypothetical protein
VYGQDGRVEVYEEPDEILRSTALGAVLTLMDPNSISIASDGFVQIDPLSAKDQLGLCSDERFADQPAPARCSAVLVRPDLALTAGHCSRDVSCEEMVVVRGFAYDAPGELRPLHSADLASCKRIVHREPPRDQAGGPGLDYAWLELDHPFEGAVGLRVTPATRIVGDEPAVLIGNGVGVPLKIDADGRVVRTDVATGHFVATVDNFGGGSGAGVFDAAGDLLGIAVTGARDYDATSDGCRKTRVLDESEGMESVTYAARAVDGLCAASSRADLCGVGATSCGIGRRLGHGVGLHPLITAIVLCVGVLRRRSRL